MWTAEDSAQDPYLEYETPTHKIMLLVGILGVVLALGRSAIYHVIYYNYLVLVYADEWSLANDLWPLLYQLNIPLVFGAMMIAVGVYSFLRRNGSSYGLLYVFTSLVMYTFSWYLLLDYTMHDLASLLSTATAIMLGVIMAVILWQVRYKSSNRGILTLIILILILQQPITILLNMAMDAFLTVQTAPVVFAFHIPGIVLTTLLYFSWAYLFYRERKLLLEGQVS